MPIDRKALRQKIQAGKEAGRRDTKMIQYPLPDLKGPGGNALALIGQGTSLMKQAGISQVDQDAFQREAMSDDYDKVLSTINDWFTVVVADVTYIPIGDVNILSLKPGRESEDWPDEGESHFDDPEVATALEDFGDRVEQDRKNADLTKQLDAQIRAELGLGPDDVVIVQVKRAKPNG